MTDEMKAKREKLFSSPKNGYDLVDQAALDAMETYCESYKQYLDNGKTERECAAYTVELAQAQGYVPYQRGMSLKPGDKVYRVNRGKSVMLAKIGRQDLSHGAQIVASHIDSPRLDFKPHPLYEDSDFAYGKTHYYGGIRKYQWVAIPLELRGVVVLRDGTVVKVVLGQGSEPKFVITDLLPHLGAEQGKKPLNEAIPGENLNILMGSRPLGEEGDSDRVKLRVMDLLHEKYGICEDDFTSAELEVVPAFNATDLGLDRSLIGAYGHDDRVCGYAALKGLFDIDVPEKTAVCMLADKEEVGSMGVTGMQSAFFDTFMEDLCQSQGVSLRVCYESSFCLSSDVTAAYDPNFAEVYEKRNESRVNYGLGICKYTGARGKNGSSDADAETVAYVRRVLDNAGVVWQIGEMGKIDAGGGEILEVEAQALDGSGKLELTGNLGSVMQESAKAALTCLRSRWEELGLPRDFYKTKDVHVHFPEGAVPKDGPSAGIAITTAMLSALTGRPVRGSVAMTGEVTLRGRVLPIGGLKEKTMAALRNGVHTVLIPRENVKDLDEIDQTVRAGLHFIPVDTVDQVFAAALVPPRGEHAAPRGRVSAESPAALSV